MYNNYCDNWERLVKAVFDRDKLKQLALAPSREPSTRSISRASSSSISSANSPIHEQILRLEGFTVNEPDWERLLPPDYENIISRSVNRVTYATKNDLYLSLCESPILLDGGKMSFHLDKRTGKKCYMIGAKELKITWGDIPKYWEWKSQIDSRFSIVAKLLEVWWLDIRGKIEAKMLSPNTHYAAYLVYRLAKNFKGLGSANGMIKFLIHEDDADAEKPATTLRLQPPKDTNSQNAVMRRPDGWMEVAMGHFYTDKGVGMVEARLLETNCWKRGLIVEGIEFRPLNADSVIFSKKNVKKVKKGFLSKLGISQKVIYKKTKKM
ncbi:F-box protein At2g02240-like [Olea europaea var. sylvestris]|uniref:F-box protein At2g02240-like n=1 Tax=Olea europaea var. sylvestris TaxID=158386 RepID=UPI000C1D1185|nr:F-box protein At2g02240-like [Olea europaea var. sylvestris]